MYEDFETHWNGRIILNKLEDINPKFYPIALKTDEKKEPPIDNLIKFRRVEKNVLTKEKWIELYGECNKFLHTWNPYTTKNTVFFETPMKAWYEMIFNLLRTHQCQMYGGVSWFIRTGPPGPGNVTMIEATENK